MPDRPHYYHHHDLPRFGEIERGARELAKKFFDWYGAVFSEGALTAREKSLIALAVAHAVRSEEHTSELQSQSNLVCRLLLEKKKKPNQNVNFSPVTIGLFYTEIITWATPIFPTHVYNLDVELKLTYYYPDTKEASFKSVTQY